MNEKLLLLFQWTEQYRHRIQLSAIPLLIALTLLIYILVYMTGGIKFVYSHSMYIVILLAGATLGMRGGVVMGLFAGIILGPMMPIDTHTHEMQDTANWLYRMAIFTLVGFLIGIASDGTRAYLKHLRWIYHHHVRTKLPNRNALLQQLTLIQHDSLTTTPSQAYLLIVLAVENALELKSVFGYAVIDTAIRELNQRYQAKFPQLSTYHTDTTQLVLLLPLQDHEYEPILCQLSNLSREPVQYDQISIHIDTRMGYLGFDQIKESPEIYLSMAEAALTTAYNTSHDNVGFSPLILNTIKNNLSLLGELKHALHIGQLFFHYQPKVMIQTGEIQGVEALIRWNHPVRGLIPPKEFIPRAEHSTLIDLITEYSLKHAIAQIAKWKQAGIEITVAVNISSYNLLQPDFADLIINLLKEHQVEGHLLELEITESTLLMDIERTIQELHRLSAMNILISIDDFGTGYSSLQYLHQLPLSWIKIDQSFVRCLPNDLDATYILEAAVMLAHKMGIQTIAEGVENQEIYQFLSNVGCDMAQGFFVSAPLTANDFETWYLASKGMYQVVS